MITHHYPHFISTDDDEFSKNGTIGVFNAAVGAIILNNQGEVLLTQRSLDNSASPGAWEIIFGRVNQGESFDEAIKRELLEEVGLTLDPESLLSLMHFTRTPQEPEHIGVIFLFRVVGRPSIKPLDKELAAWEWLPLLEAIDKVVAYTKPHLNYLNSLQLA